MRLPSFVARFVPGSASHNPSLPYIPPDLEQQHPHQQPPTGLAPPEQQNTGPHYGGSAESHLSTFSLSAYNFPPPSADLVKFQTLIGIHSPSYFQGKPPADLFRSNSKPAGALPYATGPLRPAANEGIYKRTVDEEKRVKWQYELTSHATSTMFMLQIIFGAALTALGAANGPSSAVTVLGVFNTIIAGLLTFMKGQGLPIRLEAYLNQLRALREHIEEKERKFMQEGGSGIPVEQEVSHIWEMYQEVRQHAQDNRPGQVSPPKGLISNLIQKPTVDPDEKLAAVRQRAMSTSMPPPVAPVRGGGGGVGDVLKHGFQEFKDFRRGMSAGVDEKAGFPSTTSPVTNSQDELKRRGSRGGEFNLSSVGPKDKDQLVDDHHVGGLVGRMMSYAEHTLGDGIEEGKGKMEDVRRDTDKKAQDVRSQADHVGDVVRDALHKGVHEVEKKLEKERKDDGGGGGSHS